MAIKTVLYWHKNRYEEQWNRIKDPDMNPHNYTNLIFEERSPKHTMEKRQHLQQICWENWVSSCKELKLDSCQGQLKVN
jgi:hypothetical protein